MFSFSDIFYYKMFAETLYSKFSGFHLIFHVIQPLNANKDVMKNNWLGKFVKLLGKRVL